MTEELICPGFEIRDLPSPRMTVDNAIELILPIIIVVIIIIIIIIIIIFTIIIIITIILVGLFRQMVG